MRRCLFSIFLCCVLCGAPRAADEPWAEAEALFEAGDFAGGRQILIRSLGEGNLSPEDRARVLDAYAGFHERYAGDFDQAVRTYRRILSAGLEEDHALAAEALENVARIEALPGYVPMLETQA